METDDQREAWWRQFESRISHEQAVELDDYTINERFKEIKQEKENRQKDQIISRLMYKPCFREVDTSKMTLAKKFRLLALYHYRRSEYEKFGDVVASSIIREWPVTIAYAEHDNLNTYIWDRAPLSIEIEDGYFERSGNNYVMRVLALEKEDIGTIMKSAQCCTEILEQDEDGNESISNAFIYEPIEEGGQENDKRKGSIVYF